MRKTKYLFLSISFLFFCVVGGILHIEHITADEYAQFDRSLQATKKALNLEIINAIYFQIIFIVHLILFTFFKIKDSRKPNTNKNDIN
jgi:cytochrome b subunit of formate dehydrogenase